MKCGLTVPPVNAVLPCQDYGYPPDFFSTYWTAAATKDLAAANPADPYARLLAWFAANRPTSLAPGSGDTKPKLPTWYALLEKHRDDTVYRAHSWGPGGLDPLSTASPSLCTHAVDFKAGSVTPVGKSGPLAKVTPPTCGGAVLCGSLEFPDGFWGDLPKFNALLQKASTKGPIVLVTTRPLRNRWSTVGKDGVSLLGPGAPMLGAWYSQVASRDGASKLKALPGGYAATQRQLPPLNAVSLHTPRKHTLLVTFLGSASEEVRQGLSYCAREHWPFATVLPEGLRAQITQPFAKNDTAVALSTLQL